MKKYTFLFLIPLLGACDLEKPSDGDVRDIVQCTNQQVGSSCNTSVWGQRATWSIANESEQCSALYCVAQNKTIPTDPGLTVFPPNKLIPVYFRDVEDDRFNFALNQIEDIVGRKIFDRMGVVNIPIPELNPSLPPSEIVYPSDMMNGSGFIFSKGTAYCDYNYGICSSGNVSTAPYSGNVVTYLVDDNQGIISPANSQSLANPSKYAWINFDSIHQGQVQKTASKAVAVHEVLHALGASGHFNGFGDEGAWSSNAEKVLKTMYSGQNLPGQPFSSLVVSK